VNQILPMVLVVLGVFLFFWYAARQGEKMMVDRSGKLERAIPAQATITAYQEIGLSQKSNQGKRIAIRFTLDVESAGKAPYSTTSCWDVLPMAIPQVQVGKTVAVKIDADDPMVVYPDIPSVDYSWTGEILEKSHAKRG